MNEIARCILCGEHPGRISQIINDDGDTIQFEIEIRCECGASISDVCATGKDDEAIFDTLLDTNNKIINLWNSNN